MECYRFWNETLKNEETFSRSPLVGSKTRARTKTQNLQGQQEPYIHRPSVSLCIGQNCHVSLKLWYKIWGKQIWNMKEYSQIYQVCLKVMDLHK